jgi:hypothetical protein
MNPKPAVVLLDTKDDRREVFVALLRGLTVEQRAAYHAWLCDFANLSLPLMWVATGGASVDAAKMRPILRAAREGDTLANVAHANEIYLDVAQLAHCWQLDYEACVIELENRAKGREPTPAIDAARAVAFLKSAKGPTRGPATTARRDYRRADTADPDSVGTNYHG